MTPTEALAHVKLRASIQSSERITDAVISDMIQEAVNEHSSAYATIADVPTREIEAVTLLAMERVQLLRAVGFSKESDLKGASGYGTDRNTPYYKCVDSAAAFRDKYNRLVAKLGVSSGGEIVVGTVVKRSMLNDRFMESGDVPTLPSVTLALHASSDDVSTGTTFVLEWKLDREVWTEFFEYRLFHLTGDDAIFQAWNYESTKGVPYLNNSSSQLLTIDNPTYKAAKVTGMTKSSGTKNRFVVVLVSRTGDYKLSNELVLETP